MQASMLDAVDYGAYRTTGRIIMSKSKFMEVYIRRFAESVTNSQDYQIDFYDIYEEPPKASVRIRTMSGESTINSDSLNFSIDTLISGVLETNFEQYNAINDSETEDSNNKEYLEGKSSAIRYATSYKDNITDNNDIIRLYKLDKGRTVVPSDKTIPSGTRLTLMLTDKVTSNRYQDESNLLEGNTCRYKVAGGEENKFCKVFYNGEEVYIYRMNLAYTNGNVYSEPLDSFINNDYKLCEYSSLKGTQHHQPMYLSINGLRMEEHYLILLLRLPKTVKQLLRVH